MRLIYVESYKTAQSKHVYQFKTKFCLKCVFKSHVWFEFITRGKKETWYQNAKYEKAGF